VARGRHPRRGADAALEAEAGHPGAGADGALGGRLAAAARGRRGGVGAADVVGADLHPPTVVEVGVVALPHDRDHDVVGDAAVALELDLTGGVVDAPELHGRGQVDGGLGGPPLAGGDEARALARAVEHGAARGDGALVGVVGEQQARHAGAGDSAPGRRGRLVAVHGGVADADACHVEDGVGPTSGQGPDPDSHLTHACHDRIMSDRRASYWDAGRVRIPVVWSPDTRLHVAKHEVWVGVPTPGTEVPRRVDAILAALEDHPLHEAVAHGDDLLGAVHHPDLLDFLEGASREWDRGPYADLVGQDRVVPYVFPTAAMLAGMPPTAPAALHGRAGWFCYDTMTLVGPGTWPAARAAVDVALTAVDLVAAGARAAYALCRPPGHHATPAGYGGSCYLNNAAVAAEALRRAGHERVAIVDVDAHHGNGTQAVFWERPDVLYGSLHVDPGAGWFPHAFGHASEVGARAGTGTTRNLPLPEGTGDGPWLAAVEDLADWVTSAGCTALVVSLGVDAGGDDPESPLQVTSHGFLAAGRVLGGLDLPSVLVQEGGYHLETMGGLVAAYLEGHASGS
jgi:acetoin utilization deacetylase AcuC-like enzyme